MPETSSLLAFALVALGMVLTPGPNMIYLVSRSISQGPAAGFISLAGVAVGFLVYMLCAAFGITALVLAVPYAYDVLRFGGAAYLLYLAWQAVRPGGRSPFHVKGLPKDRPRKLFMMGLLTNLLNPKVIVFYLALLPQFMRPGDPVLAKSLLLAAIHCVEGILWLGFVAWAVDRSRRFFLKPALRRFLDALCGTVLVALGIRLAFAER